MTDSALHTELRMPSVGRLLVAQIGYQSRLLASGRAVTLGVIFPVILLIASHSRGTNITAADVAQYAVFGLSLTAWNTYGVRLVAAREAGVLKRWRATPLPRWCYFLGRVIATVVVATLAAAATVAVGVLLYNTHLSVEAALRHARRLRARLLRLGGNRYRGDRCHSNRRGCGADDDAHLFPGRHRVGRPGIDQRAALAVDLGQLPAGATARPCRRHRPCLPHWARLPARSRPHRAWRLGDRRDRCLGRHLPLGAAPTVPAPACSCPAIDRTLQLPARRQRA